MMHAEIGALIDAASKPYVAAGRYAYHFSRAKLRHDRVFIALLHSGRIPERARVLDLGCGQALVASLMLAARARFEAGLWPAEWGAPPPALQILGIDSRRKVAQRAHLALAGRATTITADLREISLPDSDVVLLIDVLHYLEESAQVALLEQVAQSLRGGGLLILRVADMAAGWRFHFSRAADHVGSLLTAQALPRHYHRHLDEWLRLLNTLGFESSIDSSATVKPFANVLIWAKMPAIGQP